MPEILLARDHDHATLRRALAAQEIERLRRGAYISVDPGENRLHATVRARRHAERAVVAVHRQLTADHVVSHESAALLHGAPVWEVPRRVHVTQGYGAKAGAAADVVRHRSALSDDEVVILGDVPVTSVIRTVLDCVSTLPPLGGLVLADWALAHGVRREELVSALEARTDRRHRRRARLVLELPTAERSHHGSPGPGTSCCGQASLAPAPRSLWGGRLGTFHADVGWDGWRPLVEFDGFVKYQDGVLRPGHDADAARFDEKRRDDAIRAAGRRLVRVTARDRDTDIVRWILQETAPGERPPLAPRGDLPRP